MLRVNLVVSAAIRSIGKAHAGRIRITAAATEGRLRIVVENGIGMDEEQAARFVEPFFTAEPVGQGMGLAIRHTIARDHQGDTDVVSRPGVGATITFAVGIAIDEGTGHAH